MTINPHYTFQYSQPEGYRFSHDSVFLARRVFELERARLKSDVRVLDICAGCGIVGMDFLFHARTELGVTGVNCDFIEVQEVYEPHFAENLRRFSSAPTGKINYWRRNYADFDAPEKYDLIISNPPYFFGGEGKLSPSEFKNRCRFFLDSDFKTFLNVVVKSLNKDGSAYVLTRQPLKRVLSIAPANCLIETAGDIRGTPLLKISLNES